MAWPGMSSSLVYEQRRRRRFVLSFTTNSMADHTVANYDDPTEAHMHKSHSINVLYLESRSFFNRKRDYKI